MKESLTHRECGGGCPQGLSSWTGETGQCQCKIRQMPPKWCRVLVEVVGVPRIEWSQEEGAKVRVDLNKQQDRDGRAQRMRVCCRWTMGGNIYFIINR